MLNQLVKNLRGLMVPSTSQNLCDEVLVIVGAILHRAAQLVFNTLQENVYSANKQHYFS